MILITGGNGQLGQDFQKLFDGIGEKYIATDYAENEKCIKLDITNFEAVKNFISGFNNIKLIINCAAYNNVDKAEEEKETAYKLNAEAVYNLAGEAQNIGAEFVTYSTDFVFDGEKKEPYKETDKVNPISSYGESKAAGENKILDKFQKIFLIRTSWVFGMGNDNFVKKVIRWSKERELLKIVDDEKSAPTYSKHLAEFSWELIKTKKYGLYHITNSGESTRYDFAKYILDKINWHGKLEIAKQKDFKLPAKRPEYSKLSTDKAEKILNKNIPDWKNAVDEFLQEIGLSIDEHKRW